MEHKTTKFLEDISRGLQDAFDDRVKEQAKNAALKFMTDEGLDLSVGGKTIACDAISEHFANDIEQKVFWQAIIMSL